MRSADKPFKFNAELFWELCREYGVQFSKEYYTIMIEEEDGTVHPLFNISENNEAKARTMLAFNFEPCNEIIFAQDFNRYYNGELLLTAV